MFGAVGAFGDLRIIEIVDRTQVAGDAADAADRRFLGRLDDDFFLLDAEFDLPQPFVAAVPKLLFLGDELIDFFPTQPGIGNNLDSVYYHAAPPSR